MTTTTKKESLCQFDREFCDSVHALANYSGDDLVWPIVSIKCLPEEVDYTDLLRKQGIHYAARTVPGVYGSGFGDTQEVNYLSPQHGNIWCYVMTHVRPDSWVQTVVALSLPVADEDVGDLLQAVKDGQRRASEQFFENVRPLDAAKPRFWRLINHSWHLHMVAWRVSGLGCFDRAALRAIKNYGANREQQKFHSSLLAYGELMRSKIADPELYWRQFADWVSAGPVGPSEWQNNAHLIDDV